MCDIQRMERGGRTARRAGYRGDGGHRRDGAEEVVGGFGCAGRDQGRQALVPFAIDWDGFDRRYRVVSLDLGPPELSRKRARARTATRRRSIDDPLNGVRDAWR
jgi:hypothetical protein